jgi:Right handed beta helix region
MKKVLRQVTHLAHCFLKNKKPCIMKCFKHYLGLLSVLVFLVFACRKTDDFTTSGSDKLSFSSDTLRFDTAFTTVGSATRYIKVFNKSDKPIKISKVSLGNKTNAVFNLNIDGIAGRSFQDVEINANDSIYVFAEVNINPNAPLSISPFVIAEDIIFETNGNTQKVVMEAWGQNANYITLNRPLGDTTFAINLGGTEVIWNDPKPYVLYGVVAFANGTLVLPAGTRIYVHGGLNRFKDNSVYNDGIFIIASNAKIDSRGTFERPVIIEGDRLEEEFKNTSGQWGGVIISSAADNKLTHTIIRNSIVGVRADSGTQLTIKNCQFYNIDGNGVQFSRANVTMENSLIHTNGSSSIAITNGGNYDVKYCSFSGIGSKERTLSANNFLCTKRDPVNNACLTGIPNPLSIKATNCIFYGSKEDEIYFDDITPNIKANLKYAFKNCIIRVKDLVAKEGFPTFLTDCENCIQATGQSKVFKKPSLRDFTLDTLSIAEMKAVPFPTILSDLQGKIRDVTKPDIGCFEYQYK